MTLAPVGARSPISRRYVPGTMVLETLWQTPSGWLEVHDYMAIMPRDHDAPRVVGRVRPPDDAQPRHVIVRQATCIHGHVDVAARCAPSFDYGQQSARWDYSGSSYNQAVTVNLDQPRLILTSTAGVGIEGPALVSRHRLDRGETLTLTLAWGDIPAPFGEDEARVCLDQTTTFWREWLDGGNFPDHQWKEVLQRSALTLKALTYAPTGALLAAPTTSLPETFGGSRNWDYRYTWVRDSAFALQALRDLGFDADAANFLEFLAGMLTTGDEPVLKVLYPVDGEETPHELELSHLAGYAASSPVRVGNAAHDQLQLDALGALVDCIYSHVRTRDELTSPLWSIAYFAAQAAAAAWHLPDSGIWEMRAELRHYTFSKVMCWVALDRGAKLARLRGADSLADSWAEVAERVHDDVTAHALTSEGHFAQFYGSDDLDASLLVLARLGFLPGSDERVRATVLAVADRLSEGPYVYRYDAPATDDGLGGQTEGSFTICSFWLVGALVDIGEHERARVHAARLLASAGPLGLYAEQIDPLTSAHQGNFPQAFSHLALIDSLLHILAESKEC
jgi:GH15 family glucan-1,4-alpha-glucosidase